MTELQNPFDFVGAQASPTEEAATPMPPQSPRGVAANNSDCIGEIFRGARKLEQLQEIFELDSAAITLADHLLYDVLKAMVDPRLPGLLEIPDARALFEAIEPPPLFLQAAGY